MSAKGLDPAIRRMLETSGLEWQIVDGKKHKKLIVAGRFVLAFSHGRGREHMGAHLDNARAAVRRFLEGRR